MVGGKMPEKEKIVLNFSIVVLVMVVILIIALFLRLAGVI